MPYCYCLMEQYAVRVLESLSGGSAGEFVGQGSVIDEADLGLGIPDFDQSWASALSATMWRWSTRGM